MHKILLSTAVGLGLVNPVQAAPTDWHLIAMSSGTCVAASTSPWKSPDNYRIEAHHKGFSTDVDIMRKDGNIVMVTIKRFEHGTAVGYMYWFPSKSGCELARRILVEDGALPSSADELK